MADKVQKIKEEIEKERNNIKRFIYHPALVGHAKRDMTTVYVALGNILSFIDSLEESTDEANCTTKSEDLEEEIEKIWTNCATTWVPSVSGESSLLEESGYYELNLSKSDFKNITRHFSEWQKQQMMKDAIESVSCTYSNKEGTFLHIKQGIDTKDGDKVKIIIVKED